MTTLEQVYAELKRIEETMVRKEDLEAVADAFEILNNPATMARIQESEEAIKLGKTREIHSVQDMLNEIDA